MPRYGLRALLTLSAAAIAFTSTVVFALVVEEIATTQLEKRIGDRLAERTGEVGDKVDRALFARYQGVRILADSLRRLDLTDHPDRLRLQLESLQRHLPGYAWIGLADAHGTIRTATAGLLEGVDVASRPWFKAASQADFIGDLHPALLLEKKLNDGGDEPLRFLDLSVRLAVKDGSFAGVLGAHVDWRWIRGVITSLPQLDGSEMLLLASNRTVLLGPPDLQDRVLSLKSVEAALQGHKGHMVERWPDGKTYLTGFSQERGHLGYSGLNWVILERQTLDTAYAPVRLLQKQLVLWGLVIAFLFGALGWWIAVRISRPLRAITRAAESIQRGSAIATIPLATNYREIAVLSGTLSTLLIELKRREAELERQATHNALTQLPNRALIKALLEDIVAKSLAVNGQVAVLTVDLDRFKKVNDTGGREAGDSVLLATADRLHSCIRKYGVLGHLGKDRFVMILEKAAALQAAAAVAEHAQETLKHAFTVDGAEFYMQACIGISLFPRDGLDAEALLSNSEAALHRAKSEGSGSIKSYEAKMNALLLESVRLERELRLALSAGHLELHYQPQVSLQTGDIAGLEALIRWLHPSLGMISPAQFIPIAETSGLIEQIGDWVLNEACRQVAEWHREGFGLLRISVNVSSSQFSSGTLLTKVKASLDEHRLPSTCLQLEITESLLMQDLERNTNTIRALADMGVMIALDDFGTGYSSLSYLKRFQINELKIDRSFVADLPANEEGVAIVNAIISLAKNMNLRVVAEGVETGQQAAALHFAGCDEMQGFYFSQPLRALQCGNLLKRHTNAAASELLNAIVLNR